MNARTADITFSELLASNAAATAKWWAWFDAQPTAVLELPLSIALAYDQLPTASISDLFGIHERAHQIYGEYLANCTDGDLATVIEFPTRTAGVIRASKRKIFVHALLHSVRHWAQLATALREAGHPTNWGKDFLYSEVMP